MTFKIDHKIIHTDLQTQSRIEIDESIVNEYAEAMRRGERFPPILVYYDDKREEHILADGFHRIQAHRRVRQNEQIEVDLRRGTAEQARWASLAANASHGLRRTNADKRNAVKLALLHSSGAGMSDRAIGKYVGVDHKTVGSVRRELARTGEIPQSDSRTGQDGRTINTVNIGKPRSRCGECIFWTKNECSMNGDPRLASKGICEDFELRVPWTPEPRNHRVYRIVTNPRKERLFGISPVTNRRTKDTVKVCLPRNDPQLFAVELRGKFDKDYLCVCCLALQNLWDETENDAWGVRMETHRINGEAV